MDMRINPALLVVVAAVVSLASCTSINNDRAISDCWTFARVRDCVQVPLASNDEDMQAKLFLPPQPGKARLFLARPFTQQPRHRSTVVLDGQSIAHLAPFTYLALDIDPGRHELVIHTLRDTGFTFVAEAGQSYYFRYQIDIWLNTAAEKIKRLPEKEGQQAIWRAKLVRERSLPSR